MRRPALLCAIAASASLVGTLVAAAPADAATTCHDSHAILHAKHQERALLAEDRSDDVSGRIGSRDQLTVDLDQQSNDLADSGTTAAQKKLDAASVAKDRTEIAALTSAIAWASSDRAYFARCGRSILSKGVRRAEAHSIRLSRFLDQGALGVEQAELVYDQEQYDDALAIGDVLEEDEERAIIGTDRSTIQSLESTIAKLSRQLAKL